MSCSICTHVKRSEIESALFISDYGQNGKTLAEIAKEYNINVTDLQVHALMHTPLSRVEGEGDEVRDSIAASVKKREADRLSAVADEYYMTLKATGKEIRAIMQDKNDGGARTLTKALVDLYIGTGTNIRQTLESIVDMNVKLNGEEDSGTKALSDLVNAIRGSKND